MSFEPAISITRELTIFSLPDVVLFPGTEISLPILDGYQCEILERALVGDKKIGILCQNSTTGKLANYGGLSRLISGRRLPNGGFHVVLKGQVRFGIEQYFQKRPFLVAVVKTFYDKKSSQNLDFKTQEINRLLHEIMRLSAKLHGQKELPQLYIPQHPEALSYFVAGRLSNGTIARQSLLETRDTFVRLSRLEDVLRKQVQKLATNLAIKNAYGEVE